MRSEAGQGTVEYVGILALVAVVLAAAVAGSAVFGAGVANAVTGQIRHALCIVTGRDCVVVAERPCVVRTARDERRETVAIAFVQLGAGRVVLRERLSDGTLRLTVLHRGEAGVTAGFGSDSAVRVGGVPLSVGAHAQATVAGIVGAGQVFVVRTAAQADAIVRRLRAEGSAAVDGVRRLLRRGDGGLPRADVSFVEGGVAGRLDATLSSGEVAEAGASGGGESVLGRRVDRRTGETTWYLRLDRSLPVFADAMLGAASGGLDGDALLAVTTDRSGRAVELSALVGGRAHAGAQVTGLGEAAGGTRWEAEARVSLEDPDVRAALAAWRRSPASVDAIRGLGGALRDRARLDVRSYARSASADSDGASVSAGVRLGVQVEHERERTELLSASSRPPGGLWEPRLDCVHSAT
jgi:Flp pilus assembly pilin Flp